MQYIITFRKMKIAKSCHCGGGNSPANLLKCNGKKEVRIVRDGDKRG